MQTTYKLVSLKGVPHIRKILEHANIPGLHTYQSNISPNHLIITDNNHNIVEICGAGIETVISTGDTDATNIIDILEEHLGGILSAREELDDDLSKLTGTYANTDDDEFDEEIDPEDEEDEDEADDADDDYDDLDEDDDEFDDEDDFDEEDEED